MARTTKINTPFNTANTKELFLKKISDLTPKPAKKIRLEENWWKEDQRYSLRASYDLTPINMYLDFGNCRVTNERFKEAVDDAIRQLPEAIEHAFNRRKNITIDDTAVAMILLTQPQTQKSGWAALSNYLETGVVRRSRINIDPSGWAGIHKEDKEKWRPYNIERDEFLHAQVRLPGKRFLFDEFMFRDFPKIRSGPEYIRIKDTVLPQSLSYALVGKHINEVIEIPGFKHLDCQVRSIRESGTDTIVDITKKIIDIDQAHALAAKILKDRPRKINSL